MSDARDVAKCSCGDRLRPHINHRKRTACYTFLGPNRYDVQADGSYVKSAAGELVVPVSRPRLLDLFCGAGGAARGYQNAGFHVIGIDIVPQPNYAGDSFYQVDLVEDALEESRLPYPYIFTDFDAIHASPPCQAYTTMNNRHGSHSPPLLEMTRDTLRFSGLPYVIENVSGALAHMESPVELTGEMFGLGVHRPRLFESNVMLIVPPRPSRQMEPAAVYGKQDGRRLWTRADGTELHVATLERGSEAMGIDWMTWDELREAIPPAYTQFIGEQIMQFVQHHSTASEGPTRHVGST